MEILSRQSALSEGRKRYFTGKPCAVGHISERTASDGKCLECARVKAAARRASDPESCRRSVKLSYERNAELRRTSARDRYASDPEFHRVRARAAYALDPQKYRLKNRASYNAKPEVHRAYARSHYAQNSERMKASARARHAKNPETLRAAEKRRRASKKRAVPPWFGELDQLVWLEAADLVQRRRDATGIDWHADHMIPLRARTVSGLHTWNNCQVILAKLNMFKKNKLIFTMQGEWLSATSS